MIAGGAVTRILAMAMLCFAVLTSTARSEFVGDSVWDENTESIERFMKLKILDIPSDGTVDSIIIPWYRAGTVDELTPVVGLIFDGAGTLLANSDSTSVATSGTPVVTYSHFVMESQISVSSGDQVWIGVYLPLVHADAISGFCCWEWTGGVGDSAWTKFFNGYPPGDITTAGKEDDVALGAHGLWLEATAATPARRRRLMQLGHTGKDMAPWLPKTVFVGNSAIVEGR